MALEISEIGIHVRVPDGTSCPPVQGGRPADRAGGNAAERARMVDECVRRVLQVLAMRAER
jgi:hypothetical protein